MINGKGDVLLLKRGIIGGGGRDGEREKRILMRFTDGKMCS